MAYVSQQLKKELAPTIREICKRHGIRATLSVRNHSTLVLTMRYGTIDWGDHKSINPYGYQDHYTGAALAFLSEIIPAMNQGNWDKSDIMTDYFNVGWYVDINIGSWNNPYILTN